MNYEIVVRVNGVFAYSEAQRIRKALEKTCNDPSTDFYCCVGKRKVNVELRLIKIRATAKKQK